MIFEHYIKSLFDLRDPVCDSLGCVHCGVYRHQGCCLVTSSLDVGAAVVSGKKKKRATLPWACVPLKSFKALFEHFKLLYQADVPLLLEVVGTSLFLLLHRSLVAQLHSQIYQMQVTVPTSAFNYSFSYLCLHDEKNACIIDDIIRAMEEIQSARSTNGSAPVLHYPITQLADGRQAYIGHQLGGVQGWGPGGSVHGPRAGARGEGVRSARALQLTYYLQARGDLMDRVASQWEKAFCSELENFAALHPKLGLYPSTSSSLKTDFQFSSVLARRPLLASLGLCGVLAVLCCSMRDCVRSKPWLGLLALLSVTLSGLTAAGILNLTGATYNSTYLGIPFVMLGRFDFYH